MTRREYFLIKLKSKPNFWYTPTIEEQKKIIAYLKKQNDNKSRLLLQNFTKDENEFIRTLAQNALNSNPSEQ